MDCGSMNEKLLASWLEQNSDNGSEVCIGLDGFVDRVLRVIDKRISPTEATFISSLGEYGERISSAAGLSLNVEIVSVCQKLGGNGPIMANAMSCLGCGVTCLGAFGLPELAPEFAEFQGRAKLISLSPPARTDAYEFDDGKLIVSSLEPLNSLSWETISDTVGVDELVSVFDAAELIAINNWTMIPHMTDIWLHLQTEVFPLLSRKKRVVFLDLADPSKRTDEDIEAALQTMSAFSAFGDVTLSCNRHESSVGSGVLGLNADSCSTLETASALQDRLGIDTVSIHTLYGSFACQRGTAVSAPGFYVETPLISVGGGDHFNAGLAYGLLNGLALASAVSGYYVRTGISPGRKMLAAFLRNSTATA